MANEFKVKNGLIVIGDLTTSGTITINGALAATQSWVTSQAYLTSASLSGYATQSYVTSAISSLIDAAPAALDTLNELAAALGDDANFSTTITNSIASKQAQLNGTGLVRMSGTSVSYDNTTYLISNFGNIEGEHSYGYPSSDGWYKIAEIVLTSSCQSFNLWGEYRDTGYFDNSHYRIHITARAECDFPTNNESHAINVNMYGSSTNETYFNNNVRVVLTSSSSNYRKYELQYYRATWDTGSWNLQTLGWTTYTTSQTAGTPTGTPRVYYISKFVADNIYAANKISIGTTYSGFAANIAGTTYVIGASVWVNDGYGISNASSGGTGFFPYSDGTLTFNSANSEKMRVASSGNVGIGTNSPGYKLEVNGGATGNNIARFTTGGAGGGTRGLIMYSDSSQLKLQVSDNAGGVGTWAFLNLNPDGGNVGVGTTSPDSRFTVKGDNALIDVQSTADGQTIGFLARYLNSTTLGGAFRYTTGDAQLYIDNFYEGNNGVYSDINIRNCDTGGNLINRIKIKGSSGNVGIGTSTPANKLVVTSDASPTSENSYSIAAASATDPAYKTVIGYDYSNDIGLIAAVRTGIGWRNLSIPQGSLGIGTYNPGTKLHVVGNAWINRPSNKVDNAGATELGPRVEFNNSFASGQSGYMIFRYPTYNNFLISGDYDGNIGGAIPNIQFGKQSTVYLHMNSSDGNIGIGTTSPGATLDVNGALSNGRSIIRVTNSDTANYVTVGAGIPGISNAGMNFTLDGTSRMVISAGGNVGIGTTNPTAPLEIINTGSAGGGLTMFGSAYYGGLKYWGMRMYGIDNGNGIHYSTDVQVGADWYSATKVGHGQNAANPSFQSYYTTYLATTSGNVGIGTTSPNYKLDVNGYINIYPGNGLRWGSGDAEIINSGYNLLFKTYNGSALAEAMRINSAGKVSIGTTDTNSDKSDFTVYTGAGATIALTYDQVRMGGTDVNWSVAIRQGGSFETYGQALGLYTANGNYPVNIVPNGTTSAQFYTDYTYFPGLDFAISRVNSTHGAGNFFRGDGSHLVIGTGGTLYLNYANTSGSTYIFGTTYVNNEQVATRAWVGAQGYLTSVSDIWVNTAGDTMSGTLSFQQPVGLSFANGQYIKDNNSGGLIIYSGAAVNINGTTTAISNNSTVGGLLGVTGIVSAGARKLSLGILDLNTSGTPGQYKIKTNIPWNYGGSDFTVNIKGFRYGVSQMVSLSVGWHFYADQFYSRNAISNGAWAPTITLAKSPDGYVIIYIPGPDYWAKLYVESVYSSNSADSYTSGWSWTDADLSDCTLIQTVPYRDLATSITGNSGTTSQTNFSSLTINSAAVATQAYVGSQGYITSYSEIDTLASVTNRGNSTTDRINVRGAGNQGGGNIMMGNTGESINKWSYLTSTHYNASSQPQGFALIGGLATSGGNAVVIGGNIYETNPATEIQFWTHSTNTHNLGGTQRGVINSAGNWGIGTTNPGDYKLYVNGGQWGTLLRGGDLGTGSDVVRMIKSDGSAAMLVRGDGKVGIGTLSPAEELHVLGRGIFDGGSGDSSTDAVVYVTKSNNNDWGLYVNAAALDYGMYARVSPSANYAIAVNNGTSWTTRITGNGRIYLNEKDTIASYDTWLRLNESSHYGSGVYTPGVMRADGGFQVSGNTVIHSGTIGSQSVSYANSAGYAGYVNNQSGQLLRYDNRTISPSETNAGYLQFGFTSWDNNGGSPYADYLHMRSYDDGSGGNDNLVMFLKSGIGMRIYQQTFGSATAYSSYADVWTTANFTSTNVSNWNTAYSWGNHASASYATTSYVTTQINNLINGAPGALDTLDELAAALGDDSNFATTVTNSIAGKVSKAGDTMTGALTLNAGLNAYASPIYVNEIRFRDTAGSPASDPYSMRWVSENSTRGAGLSWLEFQLNDDDNEEIRIYGNSCVGYGCGATSENLYHRFRADGYAWHAGNLSIGGFLTESSSLKLKENIETSEGNLEKVVNLRPVTYNKIGSQTTELGLIAEEVAEVYPEFVQYDENGEPIGVNYSRLTAALIGAVKQLTKRIETLEKNG